MEDRTDGTPGSANSNDGVVMALMGMMVGLLGRLKHKGLLDGDDIKLILDEQMLLLEQKGLSDWTTKSAHGVTQQLYDVFVPKETPKSPQ